MRGDDAGLPVNIERSGDEVKRERHSLICQHQTPCSVQFDQKSVVIPLALLMFERTWEIFIVYVRAAESVMQF